MASPVNAYQFFKQIDMPVSPGESQLPKPRIGCPMPPDFHLNIAWETANLTRIAYRDYEIYDSFIKKNDNNIFDDCIKDGLPIFVPKDINKAVIFYYFVPRLSSIVDLNDEEKKEFKSELNSLSQSCIKYRIDLTYNYLGYWKLRADVDRFGFIARREENDSDNLFVIFRGTRQSTEWFNNFQFKQIYCLSESRKDFQKYSKEEYPIKISLGFNKIYTDYRPGLLIRFKYLNILSLWFNNRFIRLNQFLFKSVHRKHTKSITDVIRNYFSNSQNTSNVSNIFISGHSLGAALACISSFHLGKILYDQRIDIPITSYVYASPRVGNVEFSRELEKYNVNIFRITNSEDLINFVPLSVWRVIGIEMNLPIIGKIMRKTFAFLGLENELFQHCGTAITFAHQTGAVSSNHNMTITYCGFLEILSKNEASN